MGRRVSCARPLSGGAVVRRAMPLYPCGGTLDPWRYLCSGAAAPFARCLRTSAVAPIPAVLRFSGSAAARSARCPRPITVTQIPAVPLHLLVRCPRTGAVAPISAPLCLAHRRPAPRRCTRHGTVGAFLCDRRPAPQCRSRRRLCLPAHCRSANRRGAHRGNVAPLVSALCPAVAPVPAAALYFSLMAAPPIAIARPAGPLDRSSVPLPSTRCPRPGAVAQIPAVSLRLPSVPSRPSSLHTLRPWRLSSVPATWCRNTGPGGGPMPSRSLPLHQSPLPVPRNRCTLPRYYCARCRSAHTRDAAVPPSRSLPAHRSPLPSLWSCCVLRRYPFGRCRRAVTAATLLLSLVTARPTHRRFPRRETVALFLCTLHPVHPAPLQSITAARLCPGSLRACANRRAVGRGCLRSSPVPRAISTSAPDKSPASRSLTPVPLQP